MKAPQSRYLKIIKTCSSKSFLLIHFKFQLLLQPYSYFVFPIKTFIFANNLKLKIYWVRLKAGRAKFSDVSGSILTLTVSVEAAPQSAFADSLDPSGGHCTGHFMFDIGRHTGLEQTQCPRDEFYTAINCSFTRESTTAPQWRGERLWDS